MSALAETWIVYKCFVAFLRPCDIFECLSATKGKKARSLLAVAGRLGGWWHTESSRVKVKRNNAKLPHTQSACSASCPPFQLQLSPSQQNPKAGGVLNLLLCWGVCIFTDNSKAQEDFLRCLMLEPLTTCGHWVPEMWLMQLRNWVFHFI